MSAMENMDGEIEIDVVELIRYLLQKAGIIVLITLLFAGVGYGIAAYLITPKYSSTTQIYVLNRQNDDNITNSDLQSSSTLTKDYLELVKVPSVLNAVIEKMNLDITEDKLRSKISVSNKSDTRILKITVTDIDPEAARDIANEVRVIASQRIEDVTKVTTVSLVDEANLPTKPSSPNVIKYIVLFAAVGMILALIIFSVKFILNDKVVTSEDIEKYLQLSVLGVIPVDQELEKRSKKKSHRK